MQRESKATLRRRMQALREALDPADLKEKSARIARRLAGLTSYRRSQAILFYMSLAHEVESDGMIEAALQEGKSVYVPVVDFASRRLKLAKLTSLEMALGLNRFGIREPKDPDLGSLQDIDFIVAPGLAFDTTGGRVGFGGGYYDKLLKDFRGPGGVAAVAFDFQVIDAVPQETGDRPVQIIVTEKRTINCVVS